MRWTLLIVGLVTLVVSVASWPAYFYAADPVAVREEARAMILHARLGVEDPPPAFRRAGEFFIERNNDLWYSKYGTFGAIASIPPLVAERIITGELPQQQGPTRLLLLNIWNTILTVGVGLMLVRIGSIYTNDFRALAGYALGCLFCTFLWNYTRAQSSEIVQVLLACMAFDGLVRFRREGKHVWLGWAWVCVAAMVFTRVYFAVLMPVVLRAVWASGKRARVSSGMAMALIVVVVGMLNWIKFGSPFLSGYHAFEAARHKLTANPLPGLYGFFVSAQKGIWWHFPLFILALAGLPMFWRRHSGEAKLLAFGALVYVVPLATIPSWAGEWSYGPRYLLFGLPLMSLPVLLARRGRVFSVACAVLLVGGGWMNFQVNQLEFFTANRLRDPLQAGEITMTSDGWPDDNAMYTGRAYFDRRPWGLIVNDLISARGDAEQLPVWATVKALPSERREAFRHNTLLLYHRTNWWWTKPPTQQPSQR